jgi:hypothetical protein
MNGPRVNISGGGGASDTQIGIPAFASISFESDGDVVSANTGGTSDDGNWVEPKYAAPGAYEIMAHQNSGDALAGGSSALDTWLALSSTRTWVLSTSGAAAKNASLTVSIRLGSTTLSSGAFALAATQI